MYNPEEDGITHLNIYSKAHTETGKLCSNFYMHFINDPIYGEFPNIEGLYHYLNIPGNDTQKEQFRIPYLKNIKGIANHLHNTYGYANMEDIQPIIDKYTIQKLMDLQHLVDPKLRGLPIVHYYNFYGKVVDVTDKYPHYIRLITDLLNYIWDCQGQSRQATVQEYLTISKLRESNLIKRVGVTEQGDPSYDDSWMQSNLPVNIIISKNVALSHKEFLDKLLVKKESTILHITCTGFAGTLIEPNTPLIQDIYDGVTYLIDNGFPVSQMVLRVDPIIPVEPYFNQLPNLISKFSSLGITRLRYSILDYYDHIHNRLVRAGVNLPWKTFTAPDNYTKVIFDFMKQVPKFTNFKSVESCAEYNTDCVGCVSQRDVDILLPGHVLDLPSHKQRYSCKCGPKQELLKRNGKHPCPNKCAYCYWKDNK